MLALVAGPAWAPAACRRLAAALAPAVPGLHALEARRVVLVDAAAPLSADDAARLGALVGESGPLGAIPAAAAWFGPRPGTRSPWSSKATEIAHACGFSSVRRLESARAVWAVGADGAPLPVPAAAWAPTFDRMTEAAYPAIASLAALFSAGAPRPVGVVALGADGPAALAAADAALGLALSAAERDYLAAAYAALGRSPTDVELMMFAQANSEHCRHKIFNATWTVDGAPRPDSLFARIRSTHAAHPNGVLSAYADNAAVLAGPVAQRLRPRPADGVYVAIPEPTHLLMKVETHNHPTGISPDPGAATGAGGELRDEGATGRGSKPRAGLTGFMVSDLHLPGDAQPWEAPVGTSPRMATALEIMIDGPLGAAAYNNEFGRPALAGFFRTLTVADRGVDGGPEWRGFHKPVMLAGGYGHIRDGLVQKGRLSPGDLLVVLGGPALLIGLGGGAASSVATGTSAEALDFASVQRANADVQRRCQEVIDACAALGPDSPIVSVHDVGAGGLSNALPELVHESGLGADIDLRAIPTDDPSLSPLELWCNEAQERYVLALHPAGEARFAALCARERAPYAVVGVATAAPHLRVRDGAAPPPIDVPLDLILGRPPRMHRVANRHPAPAPALDTAGLPLAALVDRVLRVPAVGSKEFLLTIGDRSVTGTVARDPLVGPWQVPVADVAVTTTDHTGFAGEAMALGERPAVALRSSPASARLALAEALLNLSAADVGALSRVVLSANWMAAAGHPGEDARLVDAVDALAAACVALGINIPVGKDSLSMRAAWDRPAGRVQVTAPLTVVVSAFGLVHDARRTRTPVLGGPDGRLLWVDLSFFAGRLGGSALAQALGQVGGAPADLDDPARLGALWSVLQDLGARGLVRAQHDISDGGLFVAALEMALAGRQALTLTLPPGRDPLALLFAEEPGLLLEVADADAAAVEAALGAAGLGPGLHWVGRPAAAGDSLAITQDGVLLFAASLGALHRTWAATSHAIARLRDDPACVDEAYDALLDREDPGLVYRPVPGLTDDPRGPALHLRQPRVAILREQGVNGQVEMAAAFTEAGFTAVDVHMSDLRAGASLDGFVGLALCGGFSYGDVLGAGTGWARSILYDARLRDVFAGYFARPETFTLGVCNGCQALSQLAGLVPGADGWPTFGPNRSGRFEARVSLLEILPSPSIFFAGMDGAILPVAVSHGEGRAHPPASGPSAPVAARFVDGRGAVATAYPRNPNGSPGGATAFTSTDGRATLLMPHPERVFRSVTWSWRPPGLPELSPWARFFRNARAWVG
jgi:phosphoribosylformylglycinamidine synthase